MFSAGTELAALELSSRSGGPAALVIGTQPRFTAGLFLYRLLTVPEQRWRVRRTASTRTTEPTPAVFLPAAGVSFRTSRSMCDLQHTLRTRIAIPSHYQ
jgi:hypothetical protein